MLEDKLVKSLYYNSNSSLPVCECQLGATAQKLWGKGSGKQRGEKGKEGVGQRNWSAIQTKMKSHTHTHTHTHTLRHTKRGGKRLPPPQVLTTYFFIRGSLSIN